MVRAHAKGLGVECCVVYNKSDREDDLIDTFCYGITIALGNAEGF
jgi:hypothetical protein